MWSSNDEESSGGEEDNDDDHEMAEEEEEDTKELCIQVKLSEFVMRHVSFDLLCVAAPDGLKII